MLPATVGMGESRSSCSLCPPCSCNRTPGMVEEEEEGKATLMIGIRVTPVLFSRLSVSSLDGIVED